MMASSNKSHGAREDPEFLSKKKRRERHLEEVLVIAGSATGEGFRREADSQ
jgi:hypothetical protein